MGVDMTETAFLKLFMAIVITFILVLPEFFKTPKERTRELSCLEVCLLPNFTYPLSSFNFSSVAFLQPSEETLTVMGISPNHSSFQSFAEICQSITSGLPMCSLCLVCESKGDVDFASQEQTSEGLVVRGPMEVKASDFYSLCRHFNVTAALIADPTKEDNTTCTPESHPGRATAVDEDPAREKSLNHTCRFMKNTDNCTHIFLHPEMNVKPVTCSMKIAWYILVLLVFMLGIIFIIYKILEDHRRVQRGQSHKYKSTSVLLRGDDCAKLNTLNVRFIPEALKLAYELHVFGYQEKPKIPNSREYAGPVIILTESTQRLPLVRVMEVLPPIPELEVVSTVHQQDQYTRLSLDNLD